MKISIVIPTYNHAHLIEHTLRSVMSQEFDGPSEIIVVNDGSPDDTAQVLRPYAERGELRLIEQPNAGQAAARNRGWREARGKYIAFLDDDDLWPESKLAWQAELLDQDEQAVLAYGPEATLRPDGGVDPPDAPPAPDGQVYRAFLRRNWVLSLGQTLIRRSALEQTGGLDTTIWGSDDWDLLIRLARIGSFRYQHRVALLYRVHDTNASRQAIRHTRNHLRVVRRHIRWNPLLLARHQLAAGRYFTPKLLACAGEARARRDYREATAAHLYALLFWPHLLIKPRCARDLARSVLGLLRPGPRRSAS